MRLSKRGMVGLGLGGALLGACTLVAPLSGLTDGQQAVTGGDGSTLESGEPASDAAADSPARDSGRDGLGAEDGSLGTSDAADGAHPGDSGAPVDSGHPADSGTVTDSASTADVADVGVVDAGETYVKAVMLDVPLGYWRVDDPPGSTVAHDSSGNGNDGTYQGGLTLGSPGALIGDSDTAVALGGTNGFVDVGNRFNFTGATPFTLEIWAQPQAISVNYSRLFSREVNSATRDGYLLFVRAPNGADPSTFSLERWATNANNQCPQTAAITQVWHHFVATYDGSTSRIYLDGTLAASQPAGLALNATAAELWIGASVFDTNAYFDGPIDEVAVYGAALSAARVSAHFHASGR